MARRAKAKAPPPDEGADVGSLEDVFDTAAPPPPQAYVKAPKATPVNVVRSESAVPPTGSGAMGGLAGSSATTAAGAGPWYTCGLGASLLAQSPALFALAVLLTYSMGAGLLMLLLWLLLRLCFGDCGCDCGCDGCCPDDPCCCDDCCSGDGSGGSGGSDGNRTDDGSQDVPASGVVTAASALAGAIGWRRLADHGAMAHHPDLPEFAEDVVTWRGERWCVGCVTVYPVFVVAAAALLAAGAAIPWTWALAFGLPLASGQALSALGWTRRRALKVAVKACLGAGMALALHGILQAPWPGTAQVVALMILLGAAAASAWPRRRRIAAAVAARRA